MTTLIIDVETTGVSYKDEVIELSYLPIEETFTHTHSDNSVSSFLQKIETLQKNCVTSRYRPNVNIHPKAQEIHGIKAKDLLGCPSVDTLKAPEADFYVGHNVRFDARMLKNYKPKQICTLLMARYVDKLYALNMGGHKLDNVLFFFYGDQADNLYRKYHSSCIDVVKTALIFDAIVKEFCPKISSMKELYKTLVWWKEIIK